MNLNNDFLPQARATNYAFILCPLYFPRLPSLVDFISYYCALFRSRRSRAHVLWTTLLSESRILYGHTEWYLLFLFCDNNKKIFTWIAGKMKSKIHKCIVVPHWVILPAICRVTPSDWSELWRHISVLQVFLNVYTYFFFVLTVCKLLGSIRLPHYIDVSQYSEVILHCQVTIKVAAERRCDVISPFRVTLSDSGNSR